MGRVAGSSGDCGEGTEHCLLIFCGLFFARLKARLRSVVKQTEEQGRNRKTGRVKTEREAGGGYADAGKGSETRTAGQSARAVGVCVERG